MIGVNKIKVFDAVMSVVFPLAVSYMAKQTLNYFDKTKDLSEITKNMIAGLIGVVSGAGYAYQVGLISRENISANITNVFTSKISRNNLKY
jgi:hypothetical protein